MKSSAIKVKLLAFCHEYVNGRIDAAREAIADAQRSANEETKSSAGDKYETGRAMAQLEIEKNAHQLAESLKLRKTLEQIRVDHVVDRAQIGSIVITDKGLFYLAISLGSVKVDQEEYMVVSPASPLGRRLMGARQRDVVTFNNQTYRVKELI